MKNAMIGNKLQAIPFWVAYIAKEDGNYIGLAEVPLARGTLDNKWVKCGRSLIISEVAESTEKELKLFSDHDQICPIECLLVKEGGKN